MGPALLQLVQVNTLFLFPLELYFFYFPLNLIFFFFFFFYTGSTIETYPDAFFANSTVTIRVEFFVVFFFFFFFFKVALLSYLYFPG